MVDAKILKEAEDFFRDRIKGWMINDLKRSIDAKTNFLTALGCLIYTEIIGTFLPPLDISEKGSLNEKHFYRCFFRLSSAGYLKQLDDFIRKETSGKSLYIHLRHSMTHRYIPMIGKKQEDGVYLSIHSVIARDGIMKEPKTGKKFRSPPIFLTNDNRVAIANKNYVNELEMLVDDCIEKFFQQRDLKFQEAAIKGIERILRDKKV